MKAVNLVPGDARRAGISVRPSVGPGLGVLVLLAVALAFVTLYVVTTNSISDRKAKLAQVQSQIAQQQAIAARLTSYATFAKLAQKRSDDIRQVATSRFDWHAALANIARVFPAQTSLSTLFGSASSTASISGASGSSIGGSAATLRNSSPGPAVEMSGCTKTQEDVANLMSRLRVVPGVNRVTLGDSVKNEGTGGDTTTGASCGSGPTFDLVVFFDAPPGSVPAAGAAGTGTSP
jgi:Tfp pilus assembly protein PilN